MDLEILRASSAGIIAESPVSVLIHRIEYTDDGVGGRAETETFPPAFTGRLVPRAQGRRTQAEAGIAAIDSLLLLAPWDADVRAGSDVEDTFELAGHRYRITIVTPRTWQRSVYSIHAEVEEVS